MVSHRTLQADFPEVVADRVRRALECIPADKLVLDGLRLREAGVQPAPCVLQGVGDPQARNIVLQELGLEPRYIPAQDDGLAWDQPPDDEPFTHFKPLR